MCIKVQPIRPKQYWVLVKQEIYSSLHIFLCTNLRSGKWNSFDFTGAANR